MTKEELTKIREEKNMSKGELAKELGITPMLLGRYESGRAVIPEELAGKIEALTSAAAEAATVAEIEVKKTVRKGGRKAKEKVEEVVAEVKDAVEETGVTQKVKEAAAAVEKTVKKAAGGPNIIIQSPMGGIITPADIAKKVPKNTEDVYVRVDENKLYYVLKNGKTGSVIIWD